MTSQDNVLHFLRIFVQNACVGAGLHHPTLDGRLNAMRTTIDSAGRIVIPRDIRRKAALTPGTPVEIRYRDGVVEIEPASGAVRLERRGRFLVLVPDSPPAEPLTVEAVNEILDKVRSRTDE